MANDAPGSGQGVLLKATGAMILISFWELFVLGWERGCGEKQ